MDNPRILILSLKAGAGHIRAAAAIEESVRRQCGSAEVRTIECLEFVTPFFRHGFTKIYASMIDWSPSLWRMVYETTEKKNPDSPLKSWSAWVERMNASRLIGAVKEFAPTCVICTHFIPAGIVACLRRQKKLSAGLFVALTDFDIHTAWIHEGVDRYFVATEQMAQALKHKGVGKAAITVSGIPITFPFSRKLPRAEIRTKLGLSQNRPAVLITGGGCGLGDLSSTVRALSREYPDAQYLVVAGNNKKLLAQVQAAANSNTNIIPFGFVTNMHEIMAASDFAITKPGGVTSSECLAMGLPMILINPIPGQEERNAIHLLEAGAAVSAQNIASLIYKTGILIRDSEKLERMVQAARAAACPDGAQTISEMACAYLPAVEAVRNSAREAVALPAQA